jgi:uncharacterized protein Smg (DUF494 family)
MKDSLFEMLLNLFEKTLAQLKEQGTPDSQKDINTEKQSENNTPAGKTGITELVKAAQRTSMRVFTYDEQMKLTKASYQFLMRLLTWEIIDAEVLELIINQLFFSESRFVSLEETKWTIRNALMDGLDAEQIAFLDLVLYQKEDEFTLH